MGNAQLRRGSFREAEQSFRKAVADYDRDSPDGPSAFDARSRLGEALYSQGKFEEAEVLLTDGYEGLKRRASSLPPRSRYRTLEAVDRLVMLHLLRERAEPTQKWRTERARVAAEVNEIPAGTLFHFGDALLSAGAFAEAETVLRESLAKRELVDRNDWRTSLTKLRVGTSLLGQKQYAEAEPLLLKGYEGLKAREKTIPTQGVNRIPEALGRLIELYTATDKPDEVKKWQAERAKYGREVAPLPRPTN